MLNVLYIAIVSDDVDRRARVHRALSSPVRVRLLTSLHAASTPQDARALAADVGLHLNTVRAHLAVLQDAELVSSQPEVRDRPGRPRLLYTATDEVEPEGGGPGYRFLATVLAGYLASTVPDVARVAEEAGTAWGSYLVDRPAPFESVPDEVAVGRLVETLAALGFAPEVDGREADVPRILLRQCPFLDVATEHQDVVCSLHLGLMRGALAELGSRVQVSDLLPFVEPRLCVSHLAVPA